MSPEILAKLPPKRSYTWCHLAIAGTVLWEVALVLMAFFFSAAETRMAERPRDKPLPKFRAPAVAEDGKAPAIKPKEDVKPAAAKADVVPALQPAAVCAANLGPNIQFVKDPPEAFLQARKEKKLVFFMHLAGNFEDEKFT